jgi:hypothetical protein
MDCRFEVTLENCSDRYNFLLFECLTLWSILFTAVFDIRFFI